MEEVTSNSAESFLALFPQQKGNISAEEMQHILQGIGMPLPADYLQALFSRISKDPSRLPVSELQGFYELLIQERTSVSTPSISEQSSFRQAGMSMGSGRATFHRALSQRRSYMESGWIYQDPLVLVYMKKIEQHRKQCQAEGRFLEARAAGKRLAELKTIEAEKVRNDILQRQEQELQMTEENFVREREETEASWAGRMQDYKLDVQAQVVRLEEKHAGQMRALRQTAQDKKPTRPQYSRELLRQRRVIEFLAKQGNYVLAERAHAAADAREADELESTLQNYDVEVVSKENQLHKRQQHEMNSLLQKGKKGFVELQIKHVKEMEQRHQRLRNAKAELMRLQRLEIVQLENFMEGQALAGKHKPLAQSNFRKKALKVDAV